jgi:hypothetical protein
VTTAPAACGSWLIAGGLRRGRRGRAILAVPPDVGRRRAPSPERPAPERTRHPEAYSGWFPGGHIGRRVQVDWHIDLLDRVNRTAA